MKKIQWIKLGCLSLLGSMAFSVEMGVNFIVDDDFTAGTMTEQNWQERMSAWVGEANNIYQISDVDIQLKIVNVDFEAVGAPQVIPNGTNVSDYETQCGPASNQFPCLTKDGVKAVLNEMQKRQGLYRNLGTTVDRLGADFSVVVADLQSQCGRAFQVHQNRAALRSSSMAVSIADPDCGADTFVHELGHLMGLAHGEQVARALGSNGSRVAMETYAKGWGRIVDLASVQQWVSATATTPGRWINTHTDEAYDNGEFSTIMAGNWASHWMGWTLNAQNNMRNIFSSPDENVHGRNACAGSPCGDALNGNAVRFLNENLQNYAGHEAADVDVLRYSDSKLSQCITANYSGQEVDDLSVFNCPMQDIRSIAGIEQLTSLTTINLSNNNIGPVYYLDSLLAGSANSVDLYGNDHAICSQLKALEEKYPSQVVMPDKCFNLAAFTSVIAILN